MAQLILVTNIGLDRNIASFAVFIPIHSCLIEIIYKVQSTCAEVKMQRYLKL